MKAINLTDLFGVKTKPVRWERLLIFFAALFIVDIYKLTIEPQLWHSSDTGFHLKFFDIDLPWLWLNYILNDLILVGFVLVSFRYISNHVIAIVATALLYALLSGLISPYLMNMHMITMYMTTGMDSTISTSFSYPKLEFLIDTIKNKALHKFFFLGGLALAVRYIKPTLAALCTGAIASVIVNGIVTKSISGLWIRQLPFSIIEMVVFALVFWLGLNLISYRPSISIANEERMNKGFYLGTLAVSFGVFLILFKTINIFLYYKIWDQVVFIPTILLLFLSVIFLIFSTVIFSILIYKMWSVIQDENTSITPGKAVGFLFIPIFNLYWGFKVFVGFSNNFNAYIKQNSTKAGRLSPNIFITYMLLIIAGFIFSLFPILNFIIAIAIYVVALIMISKICDAVNMTPQMNN